LPARPIAASGGGSEACRGGGRESAYDLNTGIIPASLGFVNTSISHCVEAES
jgi:hypothetical protein